MYLARILCLKTEAQSYYFYFFPFAVIFCLPILYQLWGSGLSLKEFDKSLFYCCYDSVWWKMLDLWCLKKIWLQDQGPGWITQKLLHSRVLSKYEKGQRSLWYRHQKCAPLTSLRKGSYILLKLLITINQKNVSRL